MAVSEESNTLGSAAPSSRNAGGNKDDFIILPPPSFSNPFPALNVSLRSDEQEQLLSLLLEDPAAASSSAGSSLKQLLVFSTDRMRTLLLRQGLVDPQKRTWKGKNKKNWDAADVFPYPAELNNNILGTKLLFETPANENSLDWTQYYNYFQQSSSSASSGSNASSSSGFDESNWVDAVQWASEGKLDVVTYFLHSHVLEHTKAAVHRIQKTFKASSRGISTSRVHHRLVYLPHLTALVRQVLQTSGIVSLPNVSVTSLQLDLFPLETDLFSTEYHHGLRDATVEATPSHFITSTARSLLKLQDITGTIPRIQAYGPLAEDVLRKLLHMSVDEHLMSGNPNWSREAYRASSQPEDDGPALSTAGTLPIPDSGVAALILMDRRVDWVTPMVTPLTYEGLLDDILGIDSGFLHIPTSLVNPPEETTSPVDKTNNEQEGDELIALGINGSDSLYAEVRNQHVEKFGSFLQNQAIALKQSHAEFTAHGKSKDLTEIHQFVKQIPVFAQNLRSLTNHIHLAELVKKNTEDAVFRERWQTERSILEGESCYETLEDLVAAQYPPMRFFRLLCLQSLAAGGIKSSRLDSLKRDVVQTYGYEYLFLLHNLEQAKVLRRRDGLWMDSASSFSLLRSRLFLIHPEVNTVEPDDAAYVSSGYAPISVRLVQTAVKGWKDKEEILREFPGRALDIFQTSPPQDLATAMRTTPTQPLGATVVPGTRKKPILCVMYIGGITHMEIAALRFKSQQPSFPFHIVILTTEIINGSTLLHSMK